MVKKLLHLRLLIGLSLLFAASDLAFGEVSFKGKVVTFIVGASPGGGFDTYTRAIARHFGKHVSGNPVTIVQNMPGAGTLIAANYMYNKAKPDGLTVGLFSGSMIFKHVMGEKGIRFDGRKFNWLGTPSPERHVCVLTEKIGIKSLDEWRAAKQPIKIGSLGPGNATSAFPHLLRVILGLPIQVIEGYRGTAKIRLAAESGEIHGACWGWDSIKVTWATAVESGFVRPIIQTTLEPHPDLKHVPVAIKHAKTEEDRELFRFAARAYGPSAIAYSVPPRIPQDRLEIMQKAFMETLKDPEFLADMRRIKLAVSPIDGPTISNIIADLYKVNPALLDRFKVITMGAK